MQMMTAVIVAVIGLVTALVKSKNAKEALVDAVLKAIEEKAYLFVVEAEMEWGSGTGKVKRSQVVSALMNSPYYVALPNAVKTIVNSEVIGELVDKVVEGVFKLALSSNKALKDIIDSEVLR
jgi:hypothetical protein